MKKAKRRRASGFPLWKRPRSSSKSQRRFPKRRKVADTWIGTQDLLALAHAVYRHTTWTTVTSATGTKTATWEVIYELHQDIDAFLRFQREHHGFRVEATDEAVAADITEWALDGDHKRSDYRKSLAAAIAASDVKGAAFALVCSAVPAFLKHRQRRENASNKAHVGSIGVRSVLNLTLKSVAACRPHRHGTAYRLSFLDETGNNIVWFASRAPSSLGLRLGQECSIRATIRKHDEYQGAKQTYITRGRVSLPR